MFRTEFLKVHVVVEFIGPEKICVQIPKYNDIRVDSANTIKPCTEILPELDSWGKKVGTLCTL